MKKLFKRKPKLFYGLILFIVVISLVGIKLWAGKPVQGAWFDTKWAFRQRFPISNTSGATQTNFQTQITLDTSTLISAGKMLSTCNDLRITNATGKQLPFWIEPTTCNTASTLIWINVDSIPTTGADVYLYYGNPSASPAGYTTNQVFITDMNQAVAGWPLDDTTTTQSYARAVNGATSTGRNLVLNGTFDSSSSWNFNGTGWTISGGMGVATNAQTTDLTYQNVPLVAGRSYQITYTISGYTSGSVRVLAGNGGFGTMRSANGTYTENIIAAGALYVGFQIPVNGTTLNIDNVSVTEVNIPSSTATPTQLLTDGNMEASGTGAWTAGGSATLSKQTGTSHGGTQILRITATGGTNPNASQNILSNNTVYRVYGYARSDGNIAPKVYLGSNLMWTGTTSATWQPFDFVGLTSTGNSTFYLLQSSSINGQYVEFDDVTVSLDTGIRSDSILSTLDGDMEQSGTSYWSTLNGATISKDASSPHGGTQSLKIVSSGASSQNVYQTYLSSVAGKTYRITGYARGDGTAVPQILLPNGAALWTGTNSSSWQSFDATYVYVAASPYGSPILRPQNTAPNGDYVEFDDIIINEVDPLVGIPTNGVTLGASANGHLTNAYSFDGTNDNVNIYSGSLNSVFNPSEGTIVAWAKVSGAGVWTDGTQRVIVRIGRVDGNNNLTISKSASSNTLTASYVAGGSNLTANTTTSTSGWFMVTLSWSKSSDQVKLYLNGTQSGSTLTGVGTWSGNFQSVNSVIGDASTTPGFPWSGLINDVRIYNYALTPAQIAAQYNASYDTQNYTTANDTGHELVREYNTNITVGAAATEEVGQASILNWHLDEGNGTTANDASTNANNGTLAGTTPPSWQTENNCVIGKCLLFDGQSSKITGTKAANNLQTVAFWIYPTDITSRGIMNLDGGTHKISLSSSGIVTATGWSSPTYYVNGIATTNPVLSLNQWQYVEITTATPFSTSSSFTVGTDGSTFTQGYLDEIKFYNYARSAAQALANYNSVGNLIGAARQYGPNGLIANWGLQDTTSTQSYASVSNAGQSTGRNIAVDGDMEASDTSAWTNAGSGAAFTKDTTNPHAGSRDLRITWVSGSNPLAQLVSNPIVIGRSYRVRGWFKSDGSHTSGVYDNSTPLAVSTTGGSWESFDITYVATTTGLRFRVNTSSAGYADFDDITVQEVNIPSSATTPAQLLTDGNMETSGTAAWTAGFSATLSKQTNNPHSGALVLRVASNGSLQGYAGQNILTVGNVYRIYGYARSDGTAIPKIAGNSVTYWGSGTNSTTWQPFDVVLVASSGSLLALQNQTTSGYVEFDDVTVSLDTGIRSDSILSTLDGDMEQSGTSYWTAANAATLSKDSSASHGGTQALEILCTGTGNPAARQTPLLTGKTYRLTGWAKGDGTVGPSVVVASGAIWTGTASTSWQFFDVSWIATSNLISLVAATSSSGKFVEFDDLTLTEISPLSGINTNGVTVGAAANGHLTNAYSFDGTNDFVNIYSGSLNSAFNSSEGTLIAWAKVNGSGVWTDGSVRRIVSLSVDGSNLISLAKSNANNTLIMQYYAGGTASYVSNGSDPSGWFQIAITWSKSTDQAKGYLNGTQQGATMTNLGTWAGNLTSSRVTIGADTTSGSNPWSGLINDVRLYNRALSPAEISQLYNYAPGPVAYWKMDEGTGTNVNDSSGNGNTGTWNGTLGSQWASGKYGKGGNFNGTDNYVSVSSSNTLGPTAITMAAWVKLPSGFASNGDVINRGDNSGYRMQITAGKTVAFDDRGATNQVNPSTTLTTGVWNHIEMVGDSSGLKVYLNGVLIGSNSTAYGGTNTGNLLIGSRFTSSGYLPAVIDDVKIYNYARTPQQILDDMNGGQNANNLSAQGNSLPKPLDYWKFNEGYGTTANNSGVNSTETGTLNSATWLLNNNCKANNCVNISASTNNVSFGDVSYIDSLTGFSTDFWVNPQVLGTSKMILSKANTSSQRVFAIETDPSTNSEIRVFVSSSASDTSNFCKTTGLGLTTGTWQHLAIVYDGTGPTITVYKNGNPITCTVTGTIPSSLVSGTTSNLKLGQGDDSTPTALLAYYDDLKIYNTALSQSQILLDQNGGQAEDFGTRSAPEANQLTDTAGNPPVAYWNFDEGTGSTVNDSSGNSNTGTWQGTLGNQWATGKYGKGGNFNGSDNYVSTNTSTSTTTMPNFTSEAWFKTGTASGHDIISLGGTQTGTDNSHSRDLYMGADGKIYFGIADGGSNIYTVNSLSTLNDGKWHFAVGTYTSSTKAIALYIDGVSQGTTNDTGESSFSGWWRIGSYRLTAWTQASDGYFTGQIDDVKIYNYARTQAQIAYDYNRGAPVGWWKFDECQGTTANDSSGNRNTGTITIGGSGTQTSAGTCNTSGTAWGNGVVGKFDSSLNFDGTDDYVNTNSTFSSIFQNSYSISFWMKPSNGHPAGIQSMFGNAESVSCGGNPCIVKSFLNGDGTIEFQFQPGGATTADAKTNNAIFASGQGNWTHVTIVANSTINGIGGILIYINGQLATLNATNNGSTASVTFSGYTAINKLFLGARDSGTASQLFSGQIDDVRIYNYALSLTQVQKLYNDGFSTFYGPSTGTP
ncbi:MAG TPA: DUF2341 domain-containing protein [Patescibacteria group bacterium]|nr:DUF2341 domain-containing protein [Patescibacteria group bacterium]